MRHAFQQLPELRAQLGEIDSAPLAEAARNHGRIYRASRTAGTRHH
jgi:hypothetical protein